MFRRNLSKTMKVVRQVQEWLSMQSMERLSWHYLAHKILEPNDM